MPYEQVGKNEPVCIADEVPFEIPDSWEWCRIRSVGNITRGNGIRRTETIENGHPCIRYGEIYTSYNISFMDTKSFVDKELYDKCRHISHGDVVFTLTGENKQDIAKAIAYLGKEDVAAGGDLAYWSHHRMNPLYLVYFLASPYAISKKVVLSTGDIIVHISADKIGSILIPVPPIEEQNRIVSQINCLLPYLSEYESKEHQLLQLKTTFPELLKKAILQEAVQGKLVPQDENDEPASVLLERIRAEKQALIKAGKIKKDKNESVIFRRDNSHYEKRGSEEVCIDDELPFEMPSSWAWSRISSIGNIVRGSGIRRTETIPNGLPCIRYGEIYTSYNISFEKTKSYISCELDEKCKHFNYGDIVFTLTGENKPDIAKAVAYLGDIPVAAGGDLAFWENHGMNPLYLVFFMASPYAINRKVDLATGDIIVHISGEKVGSILIPIPPLEEQDRIVHSILESFKKCQEL